MLQDFLADRPSVTSGSTPPPIPAAREDAFQPLFATRASELPSTAGARRIEAIPEQELLDAPQIELVEENGVVQRIIVTCTCCKQIELECEY